MSRESNSGSDKPLLPSLQSAIESINQIPVDGESVQRVVDKASRLAPENTELRQDQKNNWKGKLMFRSAITVVLAAVVITILNVLPGNVSPVFAQVQEALENVQTIQATSRVIGPDGEVIRSMQAWVVEPDLFRQENSMGNVMVMDLSARRAMMFNREIKRGQIVPLYDVEQARASMSELLAVVKGADVDESRLVREYSEDGADYLVYQVDASEGGVAEVVVNRVTHLPHLIIVGGENGSPRVEVSDLKFDEPMDRSLFEIVAPDGFEMEIIPRDDDVDDSGLVLKRDGTFGEIGFGSSAAEIMSVFGEPTNDAVIADGSEMRIINYDPRGVTFKVSPEHGLVMIQLLFSDPSFPSRREFGGSLESGLKIGCNPVEVATTLGEPDERRGLTADEPHGSMAYVTGDIRLSFEFINSEAYGIFLTWTPRGDDE
ncbi:MAG: hypothetical protein AAF456_15035 [Planctomycetota bacterium]